jgi:hypothetical protein
MRPEGRRSQESGVRSQESEYEVLDEGFFLFASFVRKLLTG